MVRLARVVAVGEPHHITQRGNNRQNVFLADEDRHFYLKTLREKSEQFGLTISGYCLMTNHIHLIAIPRHPDSLAKALGHTHWRYAMRFN
ncbi:MAG: putative transposase [Hyphomicrobiaceae bacterium]|jgi:putative transposase